MMFKRRGTGERTVRDNPAARALRKVEARQDAHGTADEADQDGRAAEADGDDGGAIAAYLASCEAWEDYHEETGHAVDPHPYKRLGVLLRRAKDPAAEVEVLERYVAHAGRDVDPELEMRLHRARELLEQFQE